MRRIRDSRPLWFCLADAAAVIVIGAALRVGIPAVAVAAAVWLIAAETFGLCDRRWWSVPRVLPFAALKTAAAAFVVCYLVVLLSPSLAFPPGMLVLPPAACACGLIVRAGWRAVAVRARKPVVVVDAADEPRLKTWLAYYWPEWRILEVLDGCDPSAAERCAAACSHEVACYVNGQAPPGAWGPVTPLSLDDLLERVSGRVLLDHADTVVPRWSRAGAAVKRLTDVCVAGAGLAALSPLMAILAALVKLDSRGPAIYHQQRLGLDCRPFQMLKFRSMVDQAEEDTGPVWAQANDPRCTRIGRVLRPLHLDELPQFVNVLRGEMSLVGPRPERPELVKDLLEAMPAYRKRLSVRPGITGWAQINQGYDQRMDDVYRKLEYDLYYIKRGSPLFDAAVLLRTIDAVIFGKPRRPAQRDLP
jgi:lipopolysaccharide/colanic/teichoic acid biosynthesis glycosyltransferase